MPQIEVEILFFFPLKKKRLKRIAGKGTLKYLLSKKGLNK